MVIAPTRELAIQIIDVLSMFCEATQLKLILLTSGRKTSLDVNSFKENGYSVFL